MDTVDLARRTAKAHNSRTTPWVSGDDDAAIEILKEALWGGEPTCDKCPPGACRMTRRHDKGSSWYCSRGQCTKSLGQGNVMYHTKTRPSAWVLALVAYAKNGDRSTIKRALVESGVVKPGAANSLANKIAGGATPPSKEMADKQAPPAPQAPSPAAVPRDSLEPILEATKKEAVTAAVEAARAIGESTLTAFEKRTQQEKARALEDSDAFSEALMAEVRELRAKQDALDAITQESAGTATPRQRLAPLLATVGMLVLALGLWLGPTVAAASIETIPHTYLGVIPVDGEPSHVSIVDRDHRYMTPQNPEESEEAWKQRHIAEVDAFRELLLKSR